MIDNIGDEVMVIRRDGRIVFANRAAAKMLGYPVKTLLAKSVTDLFRGEDHKRPMAEDVLGTPEKGEDARLLYCRSGGQGRARSYRRRHGGVYAL